MKATSPPSIQVKKNVHLPYPNFSGTLATGGGLVFLALLDGTVAAYDDATLDKYPSDLHRRRGGPRFCL